MGFETIGRALTCCLESLHWLKVKFEYGLYFEELYYKVNTDRDHALKFGRGLWCTAEGTLAFLDSLLVVRKCRPVMDNLGASFDAKDWDEIDIWANTFLLPNVLAFFESACEIAQSKGHKLLPSVPERGEEKHYEAGAHEVFSVDGTARVLLALCAMRDYWLLSAPIPQPMDAKVVERNTKVANLIDLVAGMICLSQNLATGPHAKLRDKGGWRRFIDDANPCLTDTTCFAILSLAAADPQRYADNIRLGYQWLLNWASEFKDKSGVEMAGWSWCPARRKTADDNQPDATSTSFALLALAEASVSETDLVRKAIRFIERQRFDDLPDSIWDEYIPKLQSQDDATFFSVLPTLPRTVAAVLRCNAVSDCNFYKEAPHRKLEELVAALISRREADGAWKVKFSPQDRSDLEAAVRDNLEQCPTDLTDGFFEHGQVWYTYIAIHALSLYVLYECAQGNLASWTPSYLASQRLATLERQLVSTMQELERERSALSTLSEQLRRPWKLMGSQIAKVFAGLSKPIAITLIVVYILLLGYATLSVFGIFGLGKPPLWLLVVTGAFLLYTLALHTGLATAYPKLPHPPNWLKAVAAIIIASVYLFEGFNIAAQRSGESKKAVATPH